MTATTNNDRIATRACYMTGPRMQRVLDLRGENPGQWTVSCFEFPVFQCTVFQFTAHRD